MIQITSLLAVATVSIGLWTLKSTFYTPRPMQELELKVQEGLRIHVVV